MSTTELYVIRVGWQAIRVPKEHPSPDQLTAEQIEAIADEANRLISTSPIVVAEVEGRLEDGISEEILVPEEKGWVERRVVRFSKPILFEAHWPQKNQELTAHWPEDLPPEYPAPVPENFMILWNGNVFCAAARCSAPLPRPYSFVFGREARRIIGTVCQAATSFDLANGPGALGPTPMYPAIYVCFAESPEDWSLGRELIDEFDTLESVKVFDREKVRSPKAAVHGLLQSMLYPVESHYEDLAVRNHCMRHEEAFYDAFESASTCFRTVCSPEVWDPKKWMTRLTSGREIRRALGECYLRYAELEEERSSLLRNMEQTARVFSEHPLLGPHREYAPESVKHVTEWSCHHILDAVRFLGEESRSRGLELATVQAAIVWALVGGLVFWLLSQLFD